MILNRMCKRVLVLPAVLLLASRLAGQEPAVPNAVRAVGTDGNIAVNLLQTLPTGARAVVQRRPGTPDMILLADGSTPGDLHAAVAVLRALRARDGNRALRDVSVAISVTAQPRDPRKRQLLQQRLDALRFAGESNVAGIGMVRSMSVPIDSVERP